MTITLFVTILTVAAAVTGLLTEAIKKAYQNSHTAYSANMVALINAVIVGCGGTAVTYMLLGIDWSVNNVICMIIMGIAVWIGAQIGYDKILQLLKQMAEVEASKGKEEVKDNDIE